MKTIYKGVLALSTILLLASGCGDDTASKGNGEGKGNGENGTSQMRIDLSTYTQDALSDQQKYSLAYMWHEEKLAYEIYLELNTLFPTKQFENIANKSEIKHIELVENMVQWYDLNITNIPEYTINYSKAELEAMPRGVFGIEAIQKLYDDLYAKGKVSQQAGLEVGCMVEVVDVNDLDKYIKEAGDNSALVDTFNILRDGSYNHYWAFDQGLKNMNITDGCCSLGAEYCKPNYPQK